MKDTFGSASSAPARSRSSRICRCWPRCAARELVAHLRQRSARRRARSPTASASPTSFTDIEDLLELDELDAVVIATPNHLHEPHVLSALAAGDHVLCERPLALTRAASSAFSPRRRAPIATVAVGEQSSLSHRRAGARRDSFRAASSASIIGMRAGAYHFKRPPEGWRHRRAESGGGAFLDHGVPLLDLALWLADYPEPVRVTAHMDRGARRERRRGLDARAARVRGRRRRSCSTSRRRYVGEEERWWFEVLATRGSARLAPLRVVKELNGRADRRVAERRRRRARARSSSRIAPSSRTSSPSSRGETPYEPPTDQVVLHRIVEAIYKVGRRREGVPLLVGRSPRATGARTAMPVRSRMPPQPLGEFRRVRPVAVEADRVGAQRDVGAVHRAHAPSRTMRIARRTASSASCTCASGRLRETSDPSRHVVAVGERLARRASGPPPRLR